MLGILYSSFSIITRMSFSIEKIVMPKIFILEANGMSPFMQTCQSYWFIFSWGNGWPRKYSDRQWLIIERPFLGRSKMSLWTHGQLCLGWIPRSLLISCDFCSSNRLPDSVNDAESHGIKISTLFHGNPILDIPTILWCFLV